MEIGFVYLPVTKILFFLRFSSILYFPLIIGSAYWNDFEVILFICLFFDFISLIRFPRQGIIHYLTFINFLPPDLQELLLWIKQLFC